jgi:chorismate mutase/prephenate dehydratase
MLQRFAASAKRTLLPKPRFRAITMAKSPARKKTTPRQGKTAKPIPPECIPAELKRADAVILALLNERAALFAQWARNQQSLNPEVAFVGQEDEAIGRAVAANPGPLSAEAVRGVFRELLSGARALVQGLKIAVLGPLYSYSHLAAIEQFGQSVEYVPVSTIAAVFEEVAQGQSDFGLVPIENSTDGRVADTLDMFTRLPLRICGEVEVAIHHTLLAKCSRAEIKEVYSKPQALSQCRNWLAKHLPNARPIEVTSTSAAAEMAAASPGTAAIASVQAGIHHGLGVLAEQIEDNPGNTTRFVVIGHEPAPRTGHDKTALMFQLEHRPGSLAETINVFKRNRLNLTWIESFPILGSKRAYLFFVEMEGHPTDSRVKKAIASLQRKTLRLEILGSFPVPEKLGGDATGTAL